MKNLNLICHSEHLNTSISSIQASVLRLDSDLLQIIYTLAGDISELKVPTLQTSAMQEGLWQHTCFEAFIAEPNELEYLEFNFSPSSLWTIYRFNDYRQRVDYTGSITPKIHVEVTETQLQLVAAIQLPKNLANINLQIGLTAVIENKHAQLTYWALQHPAPKPDFHLKAGFALLLPSTNTIN
jgi:hypothetical protein